MNITLELEPSNQITRAISQALTKELTLFLAARTKIIRHKLPKILSDAINRAPEVDSLRGGKLQAELGVPDAASRIDRLIEIWSNSIDIQFIPPKLVGNIIYASVVISAIKADFNDVLGAEEATYNTANNQVISWLEWLLLEGDKQIIKTYRIGGDAGRFSRTGLGKIMIHDQRRSWGVPPEFAGTINDNFVTRTVENINAEIDTMLQDALK